MIKLQSNFIEIALWHGCSPVNLLVLGKMPLGKMPPGKMPPGKIPPRKVPPENYPPEINPPGKLPPEKLPPGKLPPTPTKKSILLSFFMLWNILVVKISLILIFVSLNFRGL